MEGCLLIGCGSSGKGVSGGEGRPTFSGIEPVASDGLREEGPGDGLGEDFGAPRALAREAALPGRVAGNASNWWVLTRADSGSRETACLVCGRCSSTGEAALLGRNKLPGLAESGGPVL